jgi:hypothetical protein
MDLSKIASGCLVMLFVCCGIIAQPATTSPAMELPLAVPGFAEPAPKCPGRRF